MARHAIKTLTSLVFKSESGEVGSGNKAASRRDFLELSLLAGMWAVRYETIWKLAPPTTDTLAIARELPDAATGGVI
jgi:hypothetical protein